VDYSGWRGWLSTKHFMPLYGLIQRAVHVHADGGVAFLGEGE
jgi:hypothetical protein